MLRDKKERKAGDKISYNKIPAKVFHKASLAG